MAKLNFAYAIIFYLLFPAFLNAQPSDDWIKENFVVEVHTVDDFIERFNGDVDQRVRDQWFKLFDKKDISRKDILYSLFNLRSADWSEAQVETFINQAIDRECPAFLDFEGDEWYAKVNCKVQFQGKNYLTDLVLKVRKDPASGGLEWVIVSMLHSGVFAELCQEPFPYAKANRKLFLSPMSHGANFSSLKRAFEDEKNFSDCMELKSRNPLLNTLAWEVYLGNMTLMRINSIEFHFFQVPGWVFVVKQVPREDFNTGWLISELYPAVGPELAKYKLISLNIK
ncbi:MAG: hypothetical protein IPH04_19325 [Saprospirales bacterium]|nr:hypothetical protein [Saprospirales bacterium]MBK6904895.1 hypothetical protein [Saprospirales bacterium]MBK7338188.1 hypothetical protein [Saprospirales bacterium]